MSQHRMFYHARQDKTLKCHDTFKICRDTRLGFKGSKSVMTIVCYVATQKLYNMRQARTLRCRDTYKICCDIGYVSINLKKISNLKF